LNFVRKILSGALAVLFLLSLFTISAFATSDYNKNDLNFIKTLVSRSALLSSDFDTTVSSELISAAEYLGDWSEQNGEKRLISLDLASVGIVDVSGKLDASSLAFFLHPVKIPAVESNNANSTNTDVNLTVFFIFSSKSLIIDTNLIIHLFYAFVKAFFTRI
jgi:hypothetical protein